MLSRGINHVSTHWPKTFPAASVVTIERQHEGSSNDVRDRKALTDLLWIYGIAGPNVRPRSANFLQYEQSLCGLGVVRFPNSDNELLSVHPQIGFRLPSSCRRRCRLFGAQLKR